MQGMPNSGAILRNSTRYLTTATLDAGVERTRIVWVEARMTGTAADEQRLSAHRFAAENAMHLHPSLPRFLGDDSLRPDLGQGLVGHIIGQEKSHSRQMFNDGTR